MKFTLGAEVRTARGRQLLSRPYSWSFTVRGTSQEVRFAYGLPVQFVVTSAADYERVDAVVELLQTVIGPRKINRRVRCYREGPRGGWPEIKPKTGGN